MPSIGVVLFSMNRSSSEVSQEKKKKELMGSNRVLYQTRLFCINDESIPVSKVSTDQLKFQCGTHS